MRAAARLLAKVSKAQPGKSRYLEPGAPTGLTGLLNSNAPRPHLIYLYSATLDKLKTLPESSVYRQSTDALTRHRLKLVEEVTPDGYEEWRQRRLKYEEENMDKLEEFAIGVRKANNQTFVLTQENVPDEEVAPWNGEAGEPEEEGPRLSTERHDNQRQAIERPPPPVEDASQKFTLESEPSLTADQVATLENKIGAGLIEEVISVAEGELKLVDTIANAQVWEELEEKAADGQWSYFERNAHTATQKP